MTSKQAAAVLGVTMARIRQLCESGQLKGDKRGRDWWIEPQDLAQLQRRPVGRPKKE